MYNRARQRRPTYHQPPYNNTKKVCTDTGTYRYRWLNVFVCDYDVPMVTGTLVHLDTKILKNYFAKTKQGNP